MHVTAYCSVDNHSRWILWLPFNILPWHSLLLKTERKLKKRFHSYRNGIFTTNMSPPTYCNVDNHPRYIFRLPLNIQHDGTSAETLLLKHFTRGWLAAVRRNDYLVSQLSQGYRIATTYMPRTCHCVLYYWDPPTVIFPATVQHSQYPRHSTLAGWLAAAAGWFSVFTILVFWCWIALNDPNVV